MSKNCKIFDFLGKLLSESISQRFVKPMSALGMEYPISVFLEVGDYYFISCSLVCGSIIREYLSKRFWNPGELWVNAGIPKKYFFWRWVAVSPADCPQILKSSNPSILQS